MKKHTLRWIILGLLMALILAACTPAEQPAEEPAEEAGAPAEEAEDTAPPAEEEAMPEFVALPALSDPNCAGAFKEIAALDRYTVQFSLCNPDPAFLSKIAFSSFAIYSQEYIEATGGTGAILEAPIGTGPYKVEAWNRGDSIIFTRNDDYWGEKAIVPTLVFRWNAEASARLVELQAGTVDGIDNPSPDDFETIRNDSNLQLLERPALNIFYLAMTNTFTPWDNIDVRRAVAMGIDRQRIVDTFYPPGSEVASHFTPCAIPNACTGDPWYEFDVEAARALLTQAGLADGFDTKIYYRDVVRGYLPDPGLVAQEIQAQLLENLNIRAEIEVMESGAFIAESTAGNLDGLYLLGWGADYPHITNFLDFHFSEANPQFGTPFPEIYELLKQGAQIANPADAEGIYTDANNAIREFIPMVPIAHGGSGTAYGANVTGGQASPLSNELFSVVDNGKDTFVWMQNAEPISLYCADETDGESLRACEQVQESLYAYEVGGTATIPALATSCEPNADLTVWTCALREGVTFHDGSSFDANDVVASFSTGLDYTNPYHKGNTGAYEYYSYLWGLINAPEE